MCVDVVSCILPTLIFFFSVPLSLPAIHSAGIDYDPQSVDLPPTDQSLLNATYDLSVVDRLRQPLPVSPPICASISILDDGIVNSEDSSVLQITISHNGSMVTIIPPLIAMVTIEEGNSKLTVKLIIMFYRVFSYQVL